MTTFKLFDGYCNLDIYQETSDLLPISEVIMLLDNKVKDVSESIYIQLRVKEGW